MGEIFSYRRVTRGLVTDIVHFLATGESVVVLGPRNSGKVFLRKKVIDLLALEKFTPVISVKFQGAQPILSLDKAYELLREGMKRSLDVDVPPLKEDSALLSPILDYGRKFDKIPILLASNVDAMSHNVARQFLQEVRSAVSIGKLVVMLTGAYDLRDLVFGPKSEFNVANQFVLQGFDREYFEEQLEKYAKALDITFESDGAREELWKITGGNGYALRVLLWLIVEWRARNGEKNSPVKAETIRLWPSKTSVMGPDEAHMLRTAIRLIPLEPNTWENLRKMTKEGRAALRKPSGSPGALTLSGLARRTNDGYLEFSSPLFKRLACHYYDDLRFGDLYARAGNWSKAEEFYAKVEQERRLRPETSEDRPEVDLVIRSLCSSFHSNAQSGTEELCRLFAFGCRLILGFPEVTFWQREGKSEWKASPDSMQPSVEGKKAAAATLVGGNIYSGPVPIAPEWRGAGFAFVLEPGPSGSWDAVLVGDFQDKMLVSRERGEFFSELAKHFQQAYAHAAAVKRDRLRLRVQKAIATDILLKLGGDNLSTTNAFQFAQGEFSELGYRLMGHSLVYLPQHQPDASPSFAVQLQPEAPKLVLSDREEFRAIHQQVIQSGNYKIMGQASSPSSIDGESCAIVPIKGLPLSGKEKPPLGTMHLERKDRAPLSQADVEDLLLCGRQMATVIKQIRRIQALERSAAQKMNELLAGLSHDIAERWRGMRPMIDRYRSRENKYPDLKDLNDDLENAYNGIVNVTNAATNKLRLIRPSRSDFDACKFFREEMNRLVKTEHLDLKVPDSAVMISADVELLRTAINAIVQNAGQWIADPNLLKICAYVELVNGDSRPMIRFAIADNGPGVKPEHKIKIFNDRFTLRPGGTGIGLAQVKRISEAHGGQVRENGTYGKGARFEIDLPRD